MSVVLPSHVISLFHDAEFVIKMHDDLISLLQHLLVRLLSILKTLVILLFFSGKFRKGKAP